MQTAIIGEITLQNGTQKKIFKHSGAIDFFLSPSSRRVSDGRYWEIKIDDVKPESDLCFDTLRLYVRSLGRDNNVTNKYEFTAWAFAEEISFDLEDDGYIYNNIGIIKGFIEIKN